jgi:hypothetical protein
MNATDDETDCAEFTKTKTKIVRKRIKYLILLSVFADKGVQPSSISFDINRAGPRGTRHFSAVARRVLLGDIINDREIWVEENDLELIDV